MRTNRLLFIRQILFTAVAIWGAVAVTAAENNPTEAPQAGKEDVFIKEAAKRGQVEVDLGKIAAEKAENPRVKQMAKELVQDHSKANQELASIAQKHGVMLQTEIAKPNIPLKDEDAVDRLEDKSGTEFDKLFIRQTLKRHQDDIKMFEMGLQECQDPALRAFIKKQIPVLQHHLQMAVTAGRSVGVDQNLLASADQFLKETHGAGSKAIGAAPGSETQEGGDEGRPEDQPDASEKK